MFSFEESRSVETLPLNSKLPLSGNKNRISVHIKSPCGFVLLLDNYRFLI